MYINIKKHILSHAIMSVALVRIAAAVFEGTMRIFLERKSYASPDLMDVYLFRTSLISSFLQIIATSIVFIIAHKKLQHYLDLVPPSDQQGMGELQKEYLGEKNASLSVSSVNRLLQLWAVIFIGAELLYIFTSIMYRRFILVLINALAGGNALSDGTFIMLYNMTHGFKYLEILSAILLGVVMTGIFLNDRYLKLASLIVLALFLISFALFQMQTVSLMGREYGLVWTSVIYHITETVGLFLLSLYLTIAYKGL